MRVIYKYRLILHDEEHFNGAQTILMPSGAKILSVGKDPQDKYCIWALCDDSLPMAERTIFVVGTGNPLPQDGDLVFVGTLCIHPFVWHIFDGGEDYR